MYVVLAVCYVDHSCFKLTVPSAFTSQVLGLKAHTTIPRSTPPISLFLSFLKHQRSWYATPKCDCDLWTQYPKYANFIHWIFGTKIIKIANAGQVFSGCPLSEIDPEEGKQWSPTSQGALSTSRYHHKLAISTILLSTAYGSHTFTSISKPLPPFLYMLVCKAPLWVCTFPSMAFHTCNINLPPDTMFLEQVLQLRRVERFVSPTISFHHQSPFMENPYMFCIYFLVYKIHFYIMYVVFQSSFVQSLDCRILKISIR